MVIAKYISTFVFGIVGIICSIIVGFIGNTLGLLIFIGSISTLDIVLVVMSTCIFSSIFYPMYFKFGVSRMKIFTVLIFMVLFFVPTSAIEYIANNPGNIIVQKFTYFINNTPSLTQNFLALSIGLISLLISLMISIRTYNNKKF
ncbi:MAG: ABC-2 transporter permease [Clostridium sp.]|uniref:ABC-2 transporter permease n=1 Tax=Clostridium sp. TaxID=1506 RepID=UPI003D6CA350